MIMEEIDKNGFARVAKIENCIEKVNRVLGIELIINDNGYLKRKYCLCRCVNSLEFENCDKNCERIKAENDEENEHLKY